MVSLDPSQVGGSHGRVDEDAILALGGPAVTGASLPETVEDLTVAPKIADLHGIPAPR